MAGNTNAKRPGALALILRIVIAAAAAVLFIVPSGCGTSLKESDLSDDEKSVGLSDNEQTAASEDNEKNIAATDNEAADVPTDNNEEADVSSDSEETGMQDTPVIFYDVESGLWGYIDRGGKWIAEPEFLEATNFYDGLAAVESIDNKWGFINEKGEYVIQPEFDAAFAFCDGLAPVCKNETWGYVDSKGNIAVDFQFSRACCFHGGGAVVSSGSGDGVIDTNGNYIIEPVYDLVEPDSVYCGNNKYEVGLYWAYTDGYTSKICLDKNGSRLSENNFSVTGIFGEEELATAYDGNKWGYINKKGEYVIKPEFDVAGIFSEGLAYAGDNEKRGYIDETGKYVIEPEFEVALDFANGLAVVKSGGKSGFIDKKGNYVTEPKYEYLGSFTADGYACACDEEKSYIVNTNGDILLEYDYPRYTIWEIFDGGIFKLNDTEKSTAGIIDVNGKTIVEPIYDEVYVYDERGYIKALNTKQGSSDERVIEEMHIFDLKGNLLK